MITLRDIKSVTRLNPTIQHIEQELLAIVNALGPFPGSFIVSVAGFDIEISMAFTNGGWRFRCKESGKEQVMLSEASVYARIMFLSRIERFFEEWKYIFENISRVGDKAVETAEMAFANFKAEVSGKKGA